jgi:hypothetical protein
MLPPDEPKSHRVSLRLTDAQYAHLNDLRRATRQGTSALMIRALSKLTLDQIPDMFPPGEEAPILLPDEVWSELMLYAQESIEADAAFNQILLKARMVKQPVDQMALYRVMQKKADILNRQAKTLLLLRNGDLGQEDQ